MHEEVIWETSYGRHVQLSDFDGGHVDKSILFFTLIGEQTKETAAEIFAHVYSYLSVRPPTLFLNDVGQMRDSPLSVKWFAATQIKRNRPHVKKSAVFGLSPRMRTGVNAIFRTANREDIRIFETKDEAIAWLLQD